MTNQEATCTPADDVRDLAALMDAGGFWRLAPELVPRTGYGESTPAPLRSVEAEHKGRL